jgi:hypothetical protein
MCIFLQFTHAISTKSGEIRCGLHGNPIARRRSIESSYQEIEAQDATTPRFGLIDHPIARSMGGVRRVVSPGSSGYHVQVRLISLGLSTEAT